MSGCIRSRSYRQITLVHHSASLRFTHTLLLQAKALVPAVRSADALNELVEAYSDTHADLVTDAPQLSVPVSATSWAVTADAATGSGALRWQGWCDLTRTLALTPTLTLILTQSLTLTLALSLPLTRCWHDTCTEAYSALVPEEQP